VARRVLGITCLRGRLDYLLANRAETEARHRWRLAAYLVTEEALQPAEARAIAGLPVHAEQVLADLLVAPRPWPEDPVLGLAARRSLPEWLARLWHEELGAEVADALGAATNRPGPISVRANTLRASRDDVACALAREGISCEPTLYSPMGLHLLGRPNIFGAGAWRQGLFEVQDEGSQLVALAASPRPGSVCVDFCAGSGGKTLALAALMENRGELWSLDISAQRLSDQSPRLRRAGVTIARVVELAREPGHLARLGEAAEVVLVDAPCSALGTLRRGPDARWRLRPEDLLTYPLTQARILDQASRLVRPGGRLVYATCTLRRAENEEVAARFGASHLLFHPLPLEATLGSELAGRLGAGESLLLAPHLHGTDGFFVHAWQKEKRLDILLCGSPKAHR
jgi:16S rRNA (cytosine967-C5)-methyltransferase